MEQPKVLRNLVIMLCSVVSKAADRSSSDKIDKWQIGNRPVVFQAVGIKTGLL